MYHHIARARSGQLLFTTWDEGLALWRDLVDAVPHPVALCVMPNHVHLLTAAPVARPFGSAIGSFARAWNHRHHQSGVLFGGSPEPEPIEPPKRRRMHRYVVLNPCRARLTDDPLAWPLCSYLDDVGLADDPVRRRVADLLGHHGYVTADDTVQRRELPVPAGNPPTPERLVRAVSQATRTPLLDVTARQGRPRRLAVRAARQLHGWGVRQTARELGISRSAVSRVELVPDRGVDIVARLAASPVTAGLDDRVLQRWIERSRYSHLDPPPEGRD
jgi:hypothetical protein